MITKHRFIRNVVINNFKLSFNQARKTVLVGTTCSGKSTLVKRNKILIDMDDVVYDQMTPEEQAHANQPWTPEIGQFMCEMTDKYLKDWKGIFCGTVIPKDAEVVYFLKVKKSVLRSRCSKRKVKLQTALQMQDWILSQFLKLDLSKVHCIIAEENLLDCINMRYINSEVDHAEIIARIDGVPAPSMKDIVS